MAFGFFFDNARCTGCKTCEMACKDYRDLGPEATFRRVIDYEGGTWNAPSGTETAVPENVFAYHLSLACNHCGDPACTHVCPTGAMDPKTLLWDMEKCISCMACVSRCPVGALGYNSAAIATRLTEKFSERRPVEVFL